MKFDSFTVIYPFKKLIKTGTGSVTKSVLLVSRPTIVIITLTYTLISWHFVINMMITSYNLKRGNLFRLSNY